MRPHHERASTGRVTTAAGTAALALILWGVGACAAGGPGGSATGTATGPSTTMPLDQFFAGPTFTPEESAAKERQVQDLITTCMRAEGFEYRPFVPPMAASTISTGPQWGTREFAEKYGYGMSTDPYPQPSPDNQPVDPNQAIVDAMTDSEREAYYAALQGAPMMAESSSVASAPATDPSAAPTVETTTPAADETSAAQPVEMADTGCWGKASEQVWGNGFQRSGEFDDLQNRMSQLWDQGQKDPAVVEAQDRWSTCMADAGHPGLATVDAAQQSINDRVNQLYESLPHPDPSELQTASPTADIVTGNPVTAAPGYQQLQTDEIALAVADFDCRDKAGYQKTFDEANQRLQQQFVDDNRAELERFRDAMNGGG